MATGIVRRLVASRPSKRYVPERDSTGGTDASSFYLPGSRADVHVSFLHVSLQDTCKLRSSDYGNQEIVSFAKFVQFLPMVMLPLICIIAFDLWTRSFALYLVSHLRARCPGLLSGLNRLS